jgi:hypothetical protein
MVPAFVRPRSLYQSTTYTTPILKHKGSCTDNPKTQDPLKSNAGDEIKAPITYTIVSQTSGRVPSGSREA